MENDISRQSLKFENILMEHNEDYLDYIKDFKQVNGTKFSYDV